MIGLTVGIIVLVVVAIAVVTLNVVMRRKGYAMGGQYPGPL